ncbi:hypothetical protein [Pseudomonas serbica]|jgi:hypothetical protein|uniref:hypothetical protein n=1 Tax=Pseudomonas serbica TaxID=2965074 RepID=UPI00237A95FB|nr:hypothetical protein [Pseudomonas serbica]
MSYQIEITRKIAATDGHLPSQFFGGTGCDRGLILVTGDRRPSFEEVSKYLEDEIVDFMLVNYDQETGEGDFLVVDGDAPESGTVYIFDDI